MEMVILRWYMGEAAGQGERTLEKDSRQETDRRGQRSRKIPGRGSDAQSGGARKPRRSDHCPLELDQEDSGPVLKCELRNNPLPFLDLSFLICKI